jgi:hypothetical protein
LRANDLFVGYESRMAMKLSFIDKRREISPLFGIDKQHFVAKCKSLIHNVAETASAAETASI